MRDPLAVLLAILVIPFVLLFQFSAQAWGWWVLLCMRNWGKSSLLAIFMLGVIVKEVYKYVVR